MLTVADVRAYVLALPHAERCARWQRTVQLMVDRENADEVWQAAKLALFFDAKLDLKALDRIEDGAA